MGRTIIRFQHPACLALRAGTLGLPAVVATPDGHTGRIRPQTTHALPFAQRTIQQRRGEAAAVAGVHAQHAPVVGQALTAVATGTGEGVHAASLPKPASPYNAGTMLADHALLNRFQRLDSLLADHAALWKPVPFQQQEPDWLHTRPELARALLALNDTDTETLEQQAPARRDWLQPWLPNMADPAFDDLPVNTTSLPDFPPRFEHGIPGRKWAQVQHFCAALPVLQTEAIDWCCGQGHLARAVSQQHGMAVHGLERQAALCTSGTALAARWHLPVQLHETDVMQNAPDRSLQGRTALALHACGDLHRQLLKKTCEHALPGLHLAPCCYHLQTATRYQPLSQAGQTARLKLSRDDLRLAVQETVTAGQRDRQRRARHSAWRLGFDLWQRQQRGRDDYLPVPPLPDQASFESFCREAAKAKNLPPPDTDALQGFEARGWQRHADVSRLELLRHAFRRPLELWLVLDRALFLQAHGYRVRVSAFCPLALTPRNLLIQAQR